MKFIYLLIFLFAICGNAISDWLCTAYNPKDGTVIGYGFCTDPSVNVLGVTTSSTVALDWAFNAKPPTTLVFDRSTPLTHTYSKGGVFVQRPVLAILADQAAINKATALRNFLIWRQTLTAARTALNSAPNVPALQAQVSIAASMLTSYASLAGIPMTTATTQ